MGKIISIENLSELLNLRKNGDKIILAGGCFDVLHEGHSIFLSKAKKLGEILAVLLESDEKVKILKGENRPKNMQAERADALSRLPWVDFVIRLPFMKSDQDYEMLVKKIEPDIIAVTTGSKVFDWEKNYIELQDAKIVEVTERIGDFSTTKILNG